MCLFCVIEDILKSKTQVYQQVTVVHICPCLELTELKLENNNIKNVHDIVSAISPLSHLKQLFVKGTVFYQIYFFLQYGHRGFVLNSTGNPLSQTHTDLELQSVFAKDTSVELLDGVNIRPAKIQVSSGR